MPILVQAPGIVASQPAAGVAASTATSVLDPTTISLVSVNTTTTNYAAGSVLAIPIPGSGKLEGKRFTIVMTGFVSVVTTSTVKIDWYGVQTLPTVLGTGTGGQLAVGSYTKLTAATASASLTGAALPAPDVYDFVSRLELYGTTTSGNLNGLLYSGYNGVAPVDNGVAITKLTGLTFGPAVTSTPATTTLDPVCWIAPAFTLTSGNAATYFQIDALYLWAD